MSDLRTWPARRVKVIEGVTIKGSNGERDLRGLHANRPDADSLPVGSTYWSVDEPSAPGTVFVTDGVSWEAVAAL